MEIRYNLLLISLAIQKSNELKPKKIYAELKDLIDKLDYRLILDNGNFDSGYCLLEEERIIVLNTLKPIEQRIQAISQAFARLDTSKIYIKSIIREMIEAESDLSQLSLIK